MAKIIKTRVIFAIAAKYPQISPNANGSAGVRLKKPETPAGLTRQITALEADLANTSVAPAQTPKGGMQRLERARKANVVTNLKNKRTRLG
ncbi:MAG: hypothetical protein P4L68_10470 [Methylovirgula sp.]|nr:hypothetical protein [Methylovirgula sp.]